MAQVEALCASRGLALSKVSWRRSSRPRGPRVCPRLSGLRTGEPARASACACGASLAGVDFSLKRGAPPVGRHPRSPSRSLRRPQRSRGTRRRRLPARRLRAAQPAGHATLPLLQSAAGPRRGSAGIAGARPLPAALRDQYSSRGRFSRVGKRGRHPAGRRGAQRRTARGEALSQRDRALFPAARDPCANGGRHGSAGARARCLRWRRLRAPRIHPGRHAGRPHARRAAAEGGHPAHRQRNRRCAERHPRPSHPASRSQAGERADPVGVAARAGAHRLRHRVAGRGDPAFHQRRRAPPNTRRRKR